MFRILALLVLWTFGAGHCAAAERVLTLTFGGEVRHVTAAELLARPDTTFLTVPKDAAYHREMKYRAVPLLALIGSELNGDFDTIEARASDGYASQIPSALVTKSSVGGAVPWIAVEDPAASWPKLPGQTVSAGPFYLVWENPERSDVGDAQWPFSLVSLSGGEDPLKRWPQMAVDSSVAEDAPERRGQAVFAKICLSCHRIEAAGDGEMGPDLGQPMNVTEYITPKGIRAIIRDPKAVRTWPHQQMEAFDEAAISNSDVDAVIAYLAYMGKRKSARDGAVSKPAP